MLTRNFHAINVYLCKRRAIILTTVPINVFMGSSGNEKCNKQSKLCYLGFGITMVYLGKRVIKSKNKAIALTIVL